MPEADVLGPQPGVAIDRTVADEPRPLRRFHRRVSLVAAAAELWESRTLVKRLAGRELRIRYRKAYLGVGWALLTPVALMVTFSVVLGRAAKIPTAGAPYPLFAYLGLLPWTFFAASVSTGSLSLLNNMAPLKRAYLAREVFPVATILVAGVDFALSASVLVVLFPLFGFLPKSTSAWALLYMLIQLAFTFGVVLFLSAALVYVRDLRHVLPLALQVGLFLSPVAYGLAAIPHQVRTVYIFLNPLATVIDGYRRAILYGEAPDWFSVGVSGGCALLVAVLGYLAFEHMEAGVADVS